MSFEEYAFNTVEDEDKKKSKIKPTYVIGVAVLLLVALAYVGFNFFTSSSNAGFSVEHEKAEVETENTASRIYVHVAGEVKNPGMVELESDERVAVAIEKAGGATDNALLDSINLAKKCEDGEQISVPSKVPTDTSGATSTEAATTESSSTSNNGKVNINTADASGLQQISGIGPSKAQKIIAYREQNGKFKSVEDLTNVSGIGEKTLASIKDQICV